MLNVRLSKFSRYAILYDKSQAYLVDAVHTSALFSLPKTPEKTTLKAYRLEKSQISNFERGEKKRPDTLTIVLVTQAFVTFISNAGENLFQGFEANYYFVIKSALLLVTIGITLISSGIFLMRQKKRALSQLIRQNEIVYLKFAKPETKKKSLKEIRTDILIYSILAIIMTGPFYLYFRINNGTESICLVIVSLVYFVIFSSTKIVSLSSPAFKEYDFSIQMANK